MVRFFERIAQGPAVQAGRRRGRRLMMRLASPEPLFAGPRLALRRHKQTAHAFRRPGSLRPLQIAIGLVVLAGALASLLLGRSLAEKDQTAATGAGVVTRATAGNLALSSWAGWNGGELPASVRALVPSGKILEPATATGVTILAGDLGIGGVPRILQAIERIESSGVVTSDDFQARTYDVKLKDLPGATATVMLIPSVGAISGVICTADPSISVSATDDCANVLTSSLQLQRSKPTVVVPAAEQVEKLRTAVTRLNDARRDGLTVLTSARTSGAQARAARRLAADYDTATRGVAGVLLTALGRDSGQALTNALAAGAAGYRAFATAATRRSATGLAAARERITSADTAARAALTELGELGYEKK
ncbi:MAG TPA: hypothetical protein VNT22_02165 [Baekduia sp.]|nr:hypothetical protein [Baekduia sp.]